ncbi:MAG TPA: hypothetical protein VMM27_09920, partial [Casimicrobiaceae bacterium]|nr:hypothetical protein [Casimicrobiaceae bacterium]
MSATTEDAIRSGPAHRPIVLSARAARVVAAIAATAAASVAQLLSVHAATPFAGMLAMLTGALLFVVPELMGLRLATVVLTGIVTSVLAAAFLVYSSVSAVLFFVGWMAISVAMSRSRRLPRRALGLASTSVLAVATGAILVLAGIGTSADMMPDRPGYSPAALLPAALLLATICAFVARADAPSALWRARRIAALRDGIFRIVAIVIVCWAALWVGDRVERIVGFATFGSALEGIAAGVGWLAAAALVIPLVWAAWRWPRIAAAGQLSGRFTPAGVSESAWFACFAAVAAMGYEFSQPAPMPGRAAWVALTAAIGFMTVRVGLFSPLARPDTPLWIAFLQRPDAAARRLAARLASLWRAGSITLLGAPQVARDTGGPHLRACDATGNLESLFPLHSGHLADWLDAMPPERFWCALPARELYAPRELWSQALQRQPIADPAVYVVGAGFNRFVSLTEAQSLPHVAPVREARELGIAGLDTQLERDERLRQTREASAPEDRLVILYRATDSAFAARLATLLDGRHNVDRSVVRAWAIAIDGPQRPQWLALLGHVGPLMRTLAKRLGDAMRDRIVRKLIAGAFRSWTGTYDLLVLERGNERSELAGLIAFVRPLVDAGAFARVIALRSPEQGRTTPLTLPAASYAGEIRLPVSGAIEASAESLAQQIVEGRFAPLISASADVPTTAATLKPAATPSPQPAPEPRAETPPSAAEEGIVSVLIALTPDIAQVRSTVLDAFDEYRDKRAAVWIVGATEDASRAYGNLSDYDVCVFVIGGASQSPEALSFDRWYDEAHANGAACVIIASRQIGNLLNIISLSEPGGERRRNFEERVLADEIERFGDPNEIHDRILARLGALDREMPDSAQDATAQPALLDSHERAEGAIERALTIAHWRAPQALRRALLRLGLEERSDVIVQRSRGPAMLSVSEGGLAGFESDEKLKSYGEPNHVFADFFGGAKLRWPLLFFLSERNPAGAYLNTIERAVTIISLGPSYSLLQVTAAISDALTLQGIALVRPWFVRQLRRSGVTEAELSSLQAIRSLPRSVAQELSELRKGLFGSLTLLDCGDLPERFIDARAIVETLGTRVETTAVLTSDARAELQLTPGDSDSAESVPLLRIRGELEERRVEYLVARPSARFGQWRELPVDAFAGVGTVLMLASREDI